VVSYNFLACYSDEMESICIVSVIVGVSALRCSNDDNGYVEHRLSLHNHYSSMSNEKESFKNNNLSDDER